MAIAVSTNVSITVNSVVLSDHSNSVALDLGQDAPEITAFGDTFHVHVGGGLKTGDLSMTFYGDEAAGETGATLDVIYAAGAAVSIVLLPDGPAPATATNPSWTATYVLTSYPAVTGTPDGVPSITTTWALATAVVRATS